MPGSKINKDSLRGVPFNIPVMTINTGAKKTAVCHTFKVYVMDVFIVVFILM